MNILQGNDNFYDTMPSRSPRVNARQSQTLHRQPSRHFDSYGPSGNSLYTIDDHTSRYESPRYERSNQYGGYDPNVTQVWNTSNYGSSNTYAALGATIRAKPTSRGRSGLPPAWLDHNPQNNGFQGLGNLSMGVPSLRADHVLPDEASGEDLIPTAIVIKNIPFAVKKEQLVQVMTDLCLPLPYAFNYHFDNGVFRGLAFANFTTSEETATVITSMNHLELHGRKLRVEYKKMLPQVERDRIEREKRERRGQLEEQHRPVPTSQLQSRPSVSSLSSAMRATSPVPNQMSLDMNDPVTLNYYSRLVLWQADPSQGDVLSFPPQLPPNHRKVVHGLAHSLGLLHESTGTGDQRQVQVFRVGPGLGAPVPSAAALDPSRRGLYRAATTDFTDVRDPSLYGPLRQASAYLAYTDSQGGLSAGTNLRAAKSFADLRSHTPSPSHSNSSFPATLTANFGRFNEYGQTSPGSSRSNITPTTPAMLNSGDALLTNSMNNLNLNSGYGQRAGSPQRLRGMMSWDRETPGPIGGHRSFSANPDEQGRAKTQGGPTRQPRGPTIDRGTGFNRGRQNGHQHHESDELSPPNGVETVLE